MSPIFIKSSKQLPNHPAKAHVKFESHRISFDGGSPQLRGFRLRAIDFTTFMLVYPYRLVVQCCVTAQNLRKDHVYKSLSYIYGV